MQDSSTEKAPARPVEDLPPELWFEILSYLPRGAVVGLIGISRLLFEMAMDYKYEEIRFINADKEMMKDFKQLR